MKILHIINRLGRGGAEKLIAESLPIMKKKENIEIDVLLLTDNRNIYSKVLKSNNINVDVVPIKKLYSPFNIFYIRKYIIKGKYDIVHVHLFPSIYWASIASKLIWENRPKLIMTEHSTYNRRRGKNYLRPIEKLIYSNYNKIVSITSQTQDNVVAWLKPKQNKLCRFVVIENGVDLEKYRNAIPYKKSDICSEFTKDTKLLCMVGRFSASKDQATVIKAMQYLPKNVHLLLIGDGPLKEKNKLLAKQLGVQDNVHFLGFRNDIERLYKTVDVAMLSSNWEGFGLAAVEAMAAGLPVIASNVPGLSEIVDGAGILFNKGDSHTLANKICLLIEDSNRYNNIARSCFNRASVFNINIMVDGYLQLYKQVVEEK